MCIYCKTNKYRKIYENHVGPIPKDEDGRSFDIHHKDGNHKNNNLDNLIALSLLEHYEQHKLQEDWYACQILANRATISKDEQSAIATIVALKRVADGTHPFLDSKVCSMGGKASSKKQLENGTHHFLDPEFHQRNNALKIADGTHHFLGPETNLKRVKDGTHNLMRRPDGTSDASDRVKNGTHNFLDGQKQSETAIKRVVDGTHHFLSPNSPTQVKWTCPYCNKSGKGKGNYNHWHGNNCKFLANDK